MQDDVTEVLRGLDVRTSPPDVTAVVDRARTLRRNRLLMGALGAATGVIAAVVIYGAVMKVPQVQPEVANAPGSGQGDVSKQADVGETGGRCRVPVRPTYLPWVRSGARIPEPRVTTRRREQTLYWGRPGAMTYVILRANSEEPGEPGTATGIRIRGAEGELYAGESPTSASVLWNIEGACPLLTLQLHEPSMEPGEGRRKVLRIADSLRRR